MQINQVHFVYLGEKLPHYAKSSIILAKEFSGLDIHLIGNKTQENKIKKLNIEFTPVEEFYESKEFQKAAHNIFSPSVYRNGFWLKTMERFFVLEQFMSFNKIKSIFHAELDQLLFRVDFLIDKIRLSNESGLFFPLHSRNKAVASVFYCNDLSALKSLNDFAKQSEPVSNEMELLAKWAKKFPDSFKDLPTAIDYLGKRNLETKFETLDYENLSGIVDAAQLGQWVAGIDPKNVPIYSKPSTHFVDNPEDFILVEQDLRKLKFNYDYKTGFFTIQHENKNPVNVYNFHIHSKIHNWIEKHGVSKFVSLANSSEKVFLNTSRVQQIKSTLRPSLLKSLFSINSWHTLFRKRINQIFHLRPSSYPFISGDSFRKFSNHIWEQNSKKFELDLISDGDVIFCESDLFQEFKKHILDELSKKITLILGNSDFNFTKEANLENLDLKKVRIFAQNLADDIQGIYPIPIGLENRWRAKHGKINSFRLRRLFKAKKLNKIMWTFSIDTNVNARADAFKALLKTNMAVQLPTLTPQSHRKSLSKFRFVACPPGNGLDTHRCWEAIYLRCVPIVIKSAMTEKFAELGLPMWLVDSYEDLINLSEQDLVNKYKELEKKFDSEVIWMDYWIRNIKQENQTNFM